MTILVDTGPLVALCDPRDAQHKAALRELGRFDTTRLATCDAVLCEACFHLPYASQRRRLEAMVDELPIAPLAASTKKNLWPEVFDWMAKYAEHEPDWADAYIVALCSHDSRVEVWSYDREFRTTWRTLDGKTIALALDSP